MRSRVGASPTGHHYLSTLQVPTVGCSQAATTTITMTTNTARKSITRLEFKYEGENEEGMAIGKLTNQDANPVFPDGRWVTKKEALRIARELGVEIFDF